MASAASAPSKPDDPESTRSKEAQSGLVVEDPLGELRLKETLLRAAAVSTRHIFGGNNSNSSSNSNSRGTRHMEDSFGGGNYRQANEASANASQPQLQPLQQKLGAPPPAAGVDRNVSLLDLNEDENNLRTTCDGCTIGKIKCDGGHPCKRCLRRGSECIYREKKRCGPKRRKSVSRDDSDDDGSTGGSATGYLDGGGGHRVLTSREKGFLSKFYSSVNKFVPLTCLMVIRDGMNPLPLDIVPGISASEAEKGIYHARKAVLLGCVAVGAVFSGDQGSAGAYMQRAQMHLKDCFDSLLPEVVSCYLVMVVYYVHFLDRVKVYRYIGFAQQAYRELAHAQPELLTQAGGGYIKDSVRILTAFLHAACSNNIWVEEIDLRAEAGPEPGGGSLSRIIAIFSHVLLQLYRKGNPEAAAKASSRQKILPSTATLAAMANEADLLLSMIEDPGSFAIVCVKTLRGYFLLTKGAEQEVVDTVALPVAKALEADPGVLNFPLCWNMCTAVQSFLVRKGCSAAADSMGDIINPVRPTLAYASLGCEVSLRFFWAYAGKGAAASPPSGTGLFPNPGPGATPGCNTSPRTLMAMSEGGGDGLSYDYRRSGGAGPDVPPLSPPLSPPGPASVNRQQQEQARSTAGESSAKRRRAGPGAGLGALWPAAPATGHAPASAAELGRRAPQSTVQAEFRGGIAPSRDGGGVGRGGGGNGNNGDRQAGAGASHEDGGMPLYDMFPAGTKFANSGSMAPVTSIGLEGDQHALSFDLGGPGGADAFFHLGQKTDIAMAATAERVEGAGSEGGIIGGGNGSAPAAAAAGAGRVEGERGPLPPHTGGAEPESTRIDQHQQQQPDGADPRFMGDKI